MARKIRQASLRITRDLFEYANVDVLQLTLGKLLCDLPDAQIIEMTVIEHYDDDEFENGPPMDLWLRNTDPAEQYPELTQ